MKTPTARKLPSGAWFCRVRIDGKDVSITRPTEKEAVAEAMAVKAGLKADAMLSSKDKTITKAIDEYIEMRQNIVSPSTIRGYRKIQRLNFQSVMNQKISSVSDAKWQSLVNLEAKKYSAKTMQNNWGFMSSVIKNATGRRVEVRLPQLIPNEKEFLDNEQINIFLKAVKGKPVEIAALLALSSLRLSEIRALRWEDIDLTAGVLKVNGATVQDEKNKYVRRKETKNTTSRRTVPIIKPLQTALETVEDKNGLVIKSGQSRIYYRINAVCEDAGLPKVGVHGLRHSFASLSKHLGVPESEAMEVGGWKDVETMRKIYTHTYKKTRENYGKTFSNYFDQQEKTETDKPDSRADG